MSNLRQHTAGFICLSTSLPESSVSRSWRNGATSMDAINLENSWECSTATLQCAFDTNSLGIMSLTLVVVDVRVCNPFPFLISLCSDSLQGDALSSWHLQWHSSSNACTMSATRLRAPKTQEGHLRVGRFHGIWQPSPTFSWLVWQRFICSCLFHPFLPSLPITSKSMSSDVSPAWDEALAKVQISHKELRTVKNYNRTKLANYYWYVDGMLWCLYLHRYRTVKVWNDAAWRVLLDTRLR